MNIQQIDVAIINLINDDLGIEKGKILDAAIKVKSIKERLHGLKGASIEDIARIRREIEDAKKALKIFRLFGTSGIRGVMEDIYYHPVTTYAQRMVMSPKFAYLYGRAFGQMINQLEVWVSMDPRPSSIFMAVALIEGLIHEGKTVYFNAVTTTPVALFYPSSIVITASHNDITWNGIKAFINGIPATFDMEWEIELSLRIMEQLENESKLIPIKKTGKVINNRDEAYHRYIRYIRREIPKKEINEIVGIIPMDLAYGSAGSVVNIDNVKNKISPQLKVLLEEGMIIIGYGTEQDGRRTNYRIGAAYPYGETTDKMEDVEFFAFASGQYGYGGEQGDEHVKRTFYFPKVFYELKDTSLTKEAIFKDTSLLKEGVIFEDGEKAFLEVDKESNQVLLNRLSDEIKGKPYLPACSVDCDCDRLLCTTPFLSKQPIPYLSGDTMIMLFAFNLSEKIKKVVFTVESSLSIAKFLEKQGIEYAEVTVGDRAISDYIMDKERLESVAVDDQHKIAGGEPSGHMIFCTNDNGSLHLIDDPIITYLLILEIMRKRQKTFDSLLEEITDEVEEVFTARKPESWGGEVFCGEGITCSANLPVRSSPGEKSGSVGITLREKVYLELRERGRDRLILTPYGIIFIEKYIQYFTEEYILAYYKHIKANKVKYPVIKSTFELSAFKKLKEVGYQIHEWVELIPVATIFLSEGDGGKIEELRVKLRVTNKTWAGPADINLSFYALDRDNIWQLAGGVVSRNSGTSPKNSAYHKLWFEHYPTGLRIGNDVIKEITTATAKKLVVFTNEFIEIIRLKTFR